MEVYLEKKMIMNESLVWISSWVEGSSFSRVEDTLVRRVTECTLVRRVTEW
jgi:hypothetical protein